METATYLHTLWHRKKKEQHYVWKIVWVILQLWEMGFRLYWLIDIVYLHPNFLHLRVLKEFERLLVYLSHKSDQLMSKVSFLVGLDIQWTGYRKIPDDKFLLLILEFLTDCVLLHKLNRPIERFFLRSNTICNVQWITVVFKVAETILWFILKKASDLHGNYIN